VTLRFHRRDFGRLRQFIDRLNQLAPPADAPSAAAGPHQIVPLEPDDRASDADQG
jgi:hypothetical protein